MLIRYSAALTSVLLTATACRKGPQAVTQDADEGGPVAACKAMATEHLRKKYPDVSPEDVAFEVEFDCRESQLITALNEEVSSAAKPFRTLNEIAERLPISPVKHAFDILRPYCRSDNDIYGAFCMAGDVTSAQFMAENDALLALLPRAVKALADATANRASVNLVEVVSAFPEFAARRSDAVLLASFLGLDDNGTQTNRLKANLIYLKKWESYSAVFPWLSQYSQTAHMREPTLAFLRVLHTTRSGRATLPGLPEGEKKTYKAYSGAYFGCKNALEGIQAEVAAREAHDVGYLYQLIKLRQSFGQPWLEFLRAAERYDAAGHATGSLMKAGAEYGHKQCSTEPQAP